MNTYHMGTKCVQEDIHLEMESRDRFPIIQSTTFKYNTSEDMGKII